MRKFIDRANAWQERVADRAARRRLDPFADNFASAFMIGVVLTQFRDGPGETIPGTFVPFAALFVSAAIVASEPRLALCVSVVGQLAACALGAAPDPVVGAVVVAAAATGRRHRSDRDLGPVRADLNPVIFATAAIVAFVPWLLDWRADALFGEPAGDHNPVETAIVLTFAMFIRSNWRFASVLFRNASRRAEDAEARQELAAQEERRRIARELHDVVAHQMSVVVNQAQGASAVLKTDPTRASKALDTISTTTRDALVELRRLVAVSGAEKLEQRGLTSGDLARLAEAGEAAGLEVRVDSVPAADVPPAVAWSAHRLIQEALTNVAKHAPGARVDVSIRFEGPWLVIAVVNGKPHRRPVDVPGSGMGLVGMRERVQVFGGTLETGPTDDGGWSVVATFRTLVAPPTNE